MGTGAHVWRSVAKDHSLSCLANPNQLRFCAEELTLWRWGVALLCEPLYIGKILQGEQAKLAYTRNVLIWACSACYEICISTGKFTRISNSKPPFHIRRGGQEEMVLKLLRNAARCGLQEEYASGFLDKRQKGPTQSYLPLISQTEASL